MSRASTSPHYEGRPLPRPDDEVVDQGLAFDLGTLASRGHVSRRQVLRGFGLGAAALGLAACGGGSSSTASSSTGASTGAAAGTTAATALAEIPDETAGPYPGDGSNGVNVLTEDGVIRSDLRSSFGSGTGTAEGVPMTLELTLQDLSRDAAPYEGVAVYVWHCDRDGGYSLYSDGVTDANYLRGVQVADADGRVSFSSIFPAAYSGRWPHIHVEVYPDAASITDSSTAIATSQVALPEDVCAQAYATAGYEQSVANLAQTSLDSDNVFGEDAGELQLATVHGDADRGFTVRLTVGIDPTTTPTGGQLSGDGAPSGAPPGAGRP